MPERALTVADLARVDWAALHGAYGPSVGRHDVAAALRTLATDHDPDSDARSDALDVAVWSHGWHQGDVFPVTAAIVPFLVAWIDAGHDIGGELAEGLACYAVGHGKDAALDAAFVACGDAILAWRRKRVETVAVIGGCTGLRPRWLAVLRDARALADEEYLAIAAGEPPPWAIERARAEVSQFGAAALLAIHAPTDAAEAALGPRDRASWNKLVQRLGLTIPEVRAPFSGPLVAGTVVFAGPNLVLVRIGGRNVTVHARSTDLAKGDAVRVGLSVHGEPRLIEFQSRAGQVVRFDAE